MAISFEKMLERNAGDGALHSSFLPTDSGLSLYARAILNRYINEASTPQNQSPTIQDASQAP